MIQIKVIQICDMKRKLPNYVQIFACNNPNSSDVGSSRLSERDETIEQYRRTSGTSMLILQKEEHKYYQKA